MIGFVDDVQVGHSEIDADPEASVRFVDTYYQKGEWDVVFFNEVGLFYFLYLLLDGRNWRQRLSGSIPYIPFSVSSLILYRGTVLPTSNSFIKKHFYHLRRSPLKATSLVFGDCGFLKINCWDVLKVG